MSIEELQNQGFGSHGGRMHSVHGDIQPLGRNNDNQKKAKKSAKILTINQLKNWGVMYDQIYFGKPSSDFYIDDKNLNFKKNWGKHLEKYTF